MSAPNRGDVLARQLSRMADATDQVDEAIAFAMAYAVAHVEADDVASVEAAIEQTFADLDDGAVPGSTWIEAECGVDIDG